MKCLKIVDKGVAIDTHMLMTHLGSASCVCTETQVRSHMDDIYAFADTATYVAKFYAQIRQQKLLNDLLFVADSDDN